MSHVLYYGDRETSRTSPLPVPVLGPLYPTHPSRMWRVVEARRRVVKALYYMALYPVM